MATPTRRPSRNPTLRIDTSHEGDGLYQGVNLNVETSSAPQPWNVALEPGSPRTPIHQPNTPFLAANSYVSKGATRELQESRNLLAHLLQQLLDRPLPPPIYDGLENSMPYSTGQAPGVSIDLISSSLKHRNAGNDMSRQTSVGTGDDDGDDDENVAFTTDSTYDLMLKLKDVLVTAVQCGWQLFHDGELQDVSERPGKTSPFRRTRTSLQPSGKRSRSPTHAQMRASELLSQCIDILASVVMEDCRYKISSPRPSRPPYVLQALTLDIAQLIVRVRLREPKTISRIGFALIPAFVTFHPAMHVKLLTFFEETIMRGALHELEQVRGKTEREVLTIRNGGAEHIINHPLVSIQVEEPDESRPISNYGNTWRPWSETNTGEFSLQSTNTPYQPLSVYHLASLTAPLLASVFESIDPENSRPELLNRTFRLLDAIISTKVDAYTDILEVIAYHTPKARRAALSSLTTFWPKALGHVFITKPFHTSAYPGSPLQIHPAQDNYPHEFVPWRFGMPSTSTLEASQYMCRSCSQPVRGFGLLCPFCMCAVHFDCYHYPDGCQTIKYAMSSNQSAQAVATYRFCHVLSPKTSSQQHILRRARHSFRLVNLFTLGLCFICRKPLWGTMAQAYRCTSCKLFAHPSCASANSPPQQCDPNVSITSDYMEIDWLSLRRTFTEHYGDILLSQEYLDGKPYEDVSVIFAALWTQLLIMDNGASYGSITVKHSGLSTPPPRDRRISEFELHDLVKLYQKALTSDNLPVSEALITYFDENHLKPSGINFMFDWPMLTFIAVNMKSSYPTEKPAASMSMSLLDVSAPAITHDAKETSSNPFEVASLSRMRDILGNELQIQSDAAARLLLSHLFQLGILTRRDFQSILFDGNGDRGQILCAFPLPLGLDLSSDVETLVSAIEACLHDLDLSVNEAGFLLLVRRFWPSGMLSDYALRRAAKTVLCWIFAEDNSLASVLRDYLAKQIAVPGLRLGHDIQPWPFVNASRGSSSGGGEYLNARHSLLTRYAARWLQAVHNMDAAFYADLLYEVAFEISLDSTAICIFPHTPLSNGVAESKQPKLFDQSLRLIVKLMQASVTFTVFDDIMVRWLDAASEECHRQPIPSVFRLFSRETDAHGRSGSVTDAPVTRNDIPSFDPWRLVKDHASGGKVALGQTLRWLCLLARSGVDMPITIFTDFAFLAVRFDVSLQDGLMLVTAALSATWLRSMGRQQLHTLFPALHCLLAPQVVHCLQTKIGVADALCFVRRSLATCLLLCGCERNALTAREMVLEDEIEGLPSRRKLQTRISQASDPIVLDKELLNALERYLNANVDDMTCLVAKFFYLFLTECSLVEPHEADNFALRSAKMLSACAWSLYDIQQHDIYSLRMTLLLRVVTTDHEPFQEILQHWFQTNTNWQLRMVAVTRLFRIILDTPSPEFNVDAKRWGTSLIDVFYYFFTSMWEDAQEEIRLTVETWSQSLLPAHFEAISFCWNDALIKAPVREQEKLVAFLTQLHPHFPRWELVSFPSITELLCEDDEGYDNTSQGGPSSIGSQEAAMNRLRVSAVSLALHLVADGISIDILSLLRIKVVLLRLVGFKDVSMINRSTVHSFYVTFSMLESIPVSALPCIHDLPAVLDAAHPFNLPPSAMGGPHADDETPVSSLVGSIFVDVLLVAFCALPRLETMPIPTLKSFLESITIITYKHDFESRPLKHLQPLLRKAVRRVMDLMLLDVNFEICELALSVAQAFVKKWSASLSMLVLDCVENVAKLLNSLDPGSQQVLASEARDFIELALKTCAARLKSITDTINVTSRFASNNILIALCKRPQSRDFFVVLKDVTDKEARSSKPKDSGLLRDALLRDALSRAAEIELASFQQVLDNLKMFVEIVHHQGYGMDLIQSLGLCVANIVRRTSDWVADAFDPTALIVLTSTVVQYNKSNCRELLGHLEAALRSMLVRFHVTAKALAHVLRVTSTLYRRGQAASENPTSQALPNGIAQAISETLAEGFRLKIRVSSSTLASILEAITATEAHSSAITIESVWELAEDALHFLQQYLWSEVQFEKDYNISITIAKMILDAADQNPLVLNQQPIDPTGEKYRPHVGIRNWNLFLLAALLGGKGTWGANLFAHFPSFTLTYCNALRPFTQTGTGRPDSAAATINHAYASIKLWLLLVRKLTPRRMSDKSTEGASWHENESILMVWNELWPLFERLVNVFEAETEAGQISHLATLVWSTVADLFMFVRQSPWVLSLDAPSQMTMLARLRKLSGQESSSNKLSRVLRSITAPPVEVPFELLVSQAERDVVAAEKLDALETRRRDAGRSGPERQRRDPRAVS